MRKMKLHREIRIQRLQTKNRMVGKTFSTIGLDERRRHPWLGGAWFEPGMDEKRAEFIAAWEQETERMLKINPKLKIVD